MISLLCGEFVFNTSLTHWNNIRESISKATNEFIIDYNKHLLDIDENEEVKDDIYHKSINKKLILASINGFITDIRGAVLTTHPKFTADTLHISLLKIYMYYLDLLTVLGVAGVYALVNKSDSDGYYSVGNSCDIVTTIRSVLPFIDNKFMRESATNIAEIFQASVDNNMVIVITSIDNIPSKIGSVSFTNRFHKKGSLSYIFFNKKSPRKYINAVKNEEEYEISDDPQDLL